MKRYTARAENGEAFIISGSFEKFEEALNNYAAIEDILGDTYDLDDLREKMAREPVVHAHWEGYCTCSHCKRRLSEIMDADSYFAIGFDAEDMVACPFCGAKMDEKENQLDEVT